MNFKVHDNPELLQWKRAADRALFVACFRPLVIPCILLVAMFALTIVLGFRLCPSFGLH